MDLDDLGELAGSSRVTRPTTKFAPRSSKLALKQKEVPKPTPDTSPKLERKEADCDEKRLGWYESSFGDGTTEMEIDVKHESVSVGGGIRGEAEDVVVREIDVFLNPPLDSHTELCVMQYPLRPSHRPYGLDERCEKVRLKPATSLMELDLSIDMASRNSDRECGSDRIMEKQTLHTKWARDHDIGYSVGILMGNKLHLNLVRTIVQLRPSFDHINSGGLKRKSIAKSASEVAEKMDESMKEKLIIPSSKQSKVKQPQHDQRAEDEEQWLQLNYQGCMSDASSQCMQKMIGEENFPLKFTMTPSDYIDSLCPGSTSHRKDKAPSSRLLFSLSLDERLKKLLSEGSPLLRFSALKHFAPDTSVEDLLEVLQRHALLVQGLWVAKSSWLFPDPSKKLARDYVLLLLSKSQFISLAQVNDAGSHKEMVKEFLKSLAVERPLFKDWKLKEDPDMNFIKNYPDIAEKQEEMWRTGEDNVFRNICRSGKLLSRRTKPDFTSKAEKVGGAETGFGRMASEKQGVREMTVEAREAIPKALKKLFETHKVCSRQWVCQCLRDIAVKKANHPTADSKLFRIAAEGLSQSEHEFLEILNQVAVEVQSDTYVLRSSPQHPEYDSLRAVVIDLLRVKGKLKKADVMEAAAIVLKREIANNEYTKVMADLCMSRNSYWVLRSSDHGAHC